MAWLQLEGVAGREEGERVLEQGGAAALRLLCMREMPVHQVKESQ